VVNQALPLIRYEITDQLTMATAPCSCPRTGRLIAGISGRLDDVFTYGDVVVHPHTLRTVMVSHPEVIDYQIRQRTDGLDVDVLTSGPVPEDLDHDLAAAVVDQGLAQPTITLKTVENLERSAASGKLRRFVPLTQP